MDNLFSEDWALVGVVDPDANTAAEYLTGVIDMSLWEQVAVIGVVGDLGASASVAFSVTSSATSGGTYAAVSGKSVTVGGTSPNTGSNTQVIINVRSEEITSNNRYVKVAMTVATATSDCALVVVGKARLKPAYENDVSTVSSITN